MNNKNKKLHNGILIISIINKLDYMLWMIKVNKMIKILNKIRI